MTRHGSHLVSEIAAQAERMDRDLGAIRRALRKPLESEVARGELTVPQTAVMRAVVRSHGISLKDLSREVSLAHSTVSGIVDRLQKRGMVSRRADAADGRVSRIYPAPVVNRFVREQIPALSRGPLESALQRAGPAERDALELALRRLRELLETS
ncbi:MAG TPA: helix-turn-helix domain-containing protein [Terracidiphilus sp.]|jgi:DNA-binding MarR family transcriptional regulator|nr:helix-turn-helix domain-containing protein [Terracidiphilus sp.]